MEYTAERFEAEIDIPSYVEGYVDVEYFLGCCRECPDFGRYWSCPPYDFDPVDFWNSYDVLRVIGVRLTFSEDRTEEEMTAARYACKRQLTKELEKMHEEIPGSMPLSAGGCQICEGCTRPEDAPCRHPDKMRYSIESIGGNVGKTISKLCGIEIEWIEEGKLPEHFVLVGGLLLKA